MLDWGLAKVVGQPDDDEPGGARARDLALRRGRDHADPRPGRHARLHGPRTGRGRSDLDRYPDRRLRPGCDPVRDPDRSAPGFRDDPRRSLPQDPGGNPAQGARGRAHGPPALEAICAKATRARPAPPLPAVRGPGRGRPPLAARRAGLGLSRSDRRPDHAMGPASPHPGDDPGRAPGDRCRRPDGRRRADRPRARPDRGAAERSRTSSGRSPRPAGDRHRQRRARPAQPPAGPGCRRRPARPRSATSSSPRSPRWSPCASDCWRRPARATSSSWCSRATTRRCAGERSGRRSAWPISRR